MLVCIPSDPLPFPPVLEVEDEPMHRGSSDNPSNICVSQSKARGDSSSDRQSLSYPSPKGFGFKWDRGNFHLDAEIDIDGDDQTSAVHDVLMSLELSRRQALGLEDARNVHVEFLEAGSFNRTFLVKTTKPQDLIFRLALPVFPHYKVESEVATMRYVRSATTIPVPQVYAWDSSTCNALRCEWILMEKAAGIPYNEAEESFSLPQKIDIGRQLASWVHQLSRLRFDSIGSIFPPSPHSTSAYHLGSPIMEQFMVDWRPEYKTPTRDPGNWRPHPSAWSFARAFVDTVSAETNDERQICRVTVYSAARALAKALAEEDDDALVREEEESFFASVAKLHQTVRKDDMGSLAPVATTNTPDCNQRSRPEEPLSYEAWIESVDQPRDCPADLQHTPYSTWGHEKTKNACAKLTQLIDKLFDGQDNLPTGSTALFHWDMHSGNVFVDKETAQITALIDWEHVVARPEWLMLDAYPKLVKGGYCFWNQVPETMDEWNEEISKGREWESFEVFEFEAKMMRAGFREGLRQLQSPWLHVVNLVDNDDMEAWRKDLCQGENPFLKPVSLIKRFEEDYRGVDTNILRKRDAEEWHGELENEEEYVDGLWSALDAMRSLPPTSEYSELHKLKGDGGSQDQLLSLRRAVVRLAEWELAATDCTTRADEGADQIVYQLREYATTYLTDKAPETDEESGPADCPGPAIADDQVGVEGKDIVTRLMKRPDDYL
ncbi:phosphotransferase enzyme family-domain-containing protein [Xylariaceae sp. FL0662B]|nr:phosphotransferase enzyme family-domain-containing protein [Xylariaceae sp. FL0662B]